RRKKRRRARNSGGGGAGGGERGGERWRDESDGQCVECYVFLLSALAFVVGLLKFLFCPDSYYVPFSFLFSFSLFSALSLPQQLGMCIIGSPAFHLPSSISRFPLPNLHTGASRVQSGTAHVTRPPLQRAQPSADPHRGR